MDFLTRNFIRGRVIRVSQRPLAEVFGRDSNRVERQNYIGSFLAWHLGYSSGFPTDQSALESEQNSQTELKNCA